MPEEFSLSWHEVDVAVRRSGLPASWHPFEIRSPGYTLDEHRRLSDAAWDAMRARGLAAADKLDPDVLATLQAWTQPEVLIIVRAVEVPDGTVLYRASAGLGLGVFSSSIGDGIQFRQVRPERLADTVLSMFPAYPPLPVSPVAITQAPPRHSSGDFSDFSDRDFTAEGASPSRRDRDALAAFSQWPLHRHGTVELSLRPRHGTLRPISTLTFADTDGGRYVTFSEPLRDGGFRLRFVPSDGSHLRRWLLEAIKEGVR